ncbi:MAG TPA: major capsid protein, partial [Azospirillaceae bacterium]|nr:major capsid protein [Azospirillaceae bacterium]
GYYPGYLGALGLYNAEGVYTEAVAFDEESGALTLIKTTPRGAPAQQLGHNKGKTRYAKTARLALEAPITADMVAGVRVLGGAGQLQTAQRLLMKQVDGPTGLKAALTATNEHMYLGGIDGVVYDADGAKVLWDFFNQYGVARPDPVSFAFGAFTADGGQFAAGCMALKREVVKALNGLSLGGMRIVVLCGDNFYDAAYSNKEGVAARKAGATGKDKAEDIISANKAYSSFEFGGFTWVNYKGSDDGKVSVPTNEARLFVHGVPGLFRTFFAPADTWDFVNTEGLPFYLLQRPEKQTSSARVFEIQSNIMALCMRPLHLRRLVKA